MLDADASSQRQREKPENAPPQVVLQTVSSLAGTMLGEVLGSSLTGKLLAGALGASVGTFLTARGSRYTRRIVAVALLLAMFDAIRGGASALAAVVRRGTEDDLGHRSGQRDATVRSTSKGIELPPGPRGWVPRQPLLALAAAVAGFAVGTGATAIAGGLKNPTRTIERVSTTNHPQIPNVVGRGASTAVAILAAHGFTAAIQPRTGSHGGDSRVLAQTPSRGESRPRGSTVVLTLAVGPNGPSTVVRPKVLLSALIPNVVGLSIQQAISRLGSRFGTKVVPVDSEVTANRVLTQTPRAGEIAPLATVISLMISSRASVPRVGVPSVVGLELGAAEAKLKAAGLSAGVVRESSETIPSGFVIGSSPAAGESAGNGSTVTLTVSTGVPQLVVPSVVGLELGAAEAKLKAVGLSAGVVRESSETIPSGFVIGSSPAAGESAGKGSEIALTVSTGLRAPG
jgi:beta-lactam-binding protein with PASTA domain